MKLENTLNYLAIKDGRIIGIEDIKNFLQYPEKNEMIEFYKIDEQNYRMN